MRSLILGVVILVAVPPYAEAQGRGRSERSATGRTAVPREEAVQAAPARQTERRAEPRGVTTAPATHEEKSADAPPRAIREERRERGPAETVRRFPDAHPQAAPARVGWNNPPRVSLAPTPTVQPHPSGRPLHDREHRRRWQGHSDYRPGYWPRYSGANVVFVPYAAPMVVEREVMVEREVVADAALSPAFTEQPLLARLILDIHPPTAQVFADGYYMGIPQDFRFENGGAVVEPGPRRIDIIAPGYEPVSFNVNLARGQSATFRHVLTPAISAPQPARSAATTTPPAAKQPVTFYLIPGCYMGNVPPKEANLPPTCDIGRAVSVQY